MDIVMHETDSQNADFIMLVRQLDKNLDERNGDIQKQYTAFNDLSKLNHVIVLYADNRPAACGAFKEFCEDMVEMKRIFVMGEYRRKGFGMRIMGQLEQDAMNKGYRFAILETGINQTEAVHLYQHLGYEVTGNYGHYIGNTNSICMKKRLL